MSSLMPWDPRGGMISLRDMMDRLFEESFIRPRSGFLAPLSFADLAVDMYETKDAVVVQVALPGVNPEDVEITITGDTLQIKGEVKEEQDKEEQDYIRRERRYGSFARSVTLPPGLKDDQADATFKNGMLMLQIPKSEKAKARTIKVTAKR